MSKIITATDILRDEGIKSLLQKSKDFAKATSKGLLYNVETKDKKISDFSEVVRVEKESREVIKYAGIHDKMPNIFDTHLGNLKKSEKYCYEIGSGKIIGPHNFVKYNRKCIIPDTIGWEKRNNKYRRKFLREYPLKDHVERKRIQESDESYFILRSTYRGGNFGLWYYDVLPKLYWFEKYVSKAGSRPTILVPELAGFQEESLQLLGYDSSDYYEISNEILEPSSVILPPQPGIVPNGPADISHKSIQWVRNNLLSKIKSGDTPSRIYISREDADWRYVSNRADVMAMLSEYGFREYTLSDMQLVEQIRLFSEANIVVGPHGAGMAHMMHTRECDWIELFSGKNGVLPQYFLLSNYLNLEYEYLVCNSQNLQDDYNGPFPGGKKDMIVDVQELETIIKKVA